MTYVEIALFALGALSGIVSIVAVLAFLGKGKLNRRARK